MEIDKHCIIDVNFTIQNPLACHFFPRNSTIYHTMNYHQHKLFERNKQVVNQKKKKNDKLTCFGHDEDNEFWSSIRLTAKSFNPFFSLISWCFFSSKVFTSLSKNLKFKSNYGKQRNPKITWEKVMINAVQNFKTVACKQNEDRTQVLLAEQHQDYNKKLAITGPTRCKMVHQLLIH